MSYVVLARRWRPRRFTDLVGQDVVVRTLRNALASGNLAPVYLLTGILGVGKTTVARLLAMAVNCERPADGEPCGACDTCRAIGEGAGLDVQEMDAASHTGVDDIREILDAVRYPPTRFRYKVYVIDEVHMLSKSAFNALLKTLEEPPERVLFVLATTEVEKVPVTVRSRCQRFDLRRLGADEIASYLEHVFREEGIEHEPEARLQIARAADGSVRDALTLAERIRTYGGGRLTAGEVRRTLGFVAPEVARELSEAIFRGDAAGAVAGLRRALEAGHAPRALLTALGELWHDLACSLVDEGLPELEADAPQREWLARWAGCWDPQGLDLRYQVLVQGLRDLDVLDEQRGAEMLAMRLSHLNLLQPPRAIPDPEEAAAPVEEGGAGDTTGADSPAPDASPDGEADGAAPGSRGSLAGEVEAMETATPAPAEEAVGETPEATPADAVEGDLPMDDAEASAGAHHASWEEAVHAYADIKPGVAGLLDHVICLDFGPRVRLALDAHQERAISAAERRAFAEWLGREVHWEPKREEGGETLSQIRARRAEAEARRLRRQAEEDPHVRAVAEEFGARLEGVRPPGAAGLEEIRDD